MPAHVNERHPSGTRLRRSVAPLIALALLVVACGTGQASSGQTGIDPQLVGALSDDEAAEAAASVNTFGFGLHREVAEDRANTVTSPLSASVLLALVAAGAGGEAADAMTEALHLDGARDTRFAALLADLGDTEDVTLLIANALWADEGTAFEQDYLDFARDTFGARIEEAALGEQSTADAIDDWVAERTEGRIEEMAEDLGLPSEQAVLVLMNAVYFRGEWTEQFDPDDTRDAPFTLADGGNVEVPTMHRSEDGLELETTARDDFRMVRLPYGGTGRFGMEILLPDEDSGLDTLLGDLDHATWRAAVDDLSPSRVGTFALPRFEIEWEAELREALDALGMGVALTPDADFSPMSATDPSLGTIVQKTFLRVDEQGTEAAAAIGAVMDESGPGDVRVDRPFAFTISDRETGAILFLGTVHDPRG